MRKLNVAFRVDASAIIGTGHVMRCLTLANQLRRDNVAVTFFCRQLSGDLTDLIAGQGFPVCRLPAPGGNSERNIWRWYLENWQADARETLALLKKNNLRPDVMVVDHYGLDKKWESLLRERAESIMVIDDLANRRHQCDLLLDQNDYCEQEKRYDGLIPVSCKTLLGPDYSLLRDEFIHTSRRQRDGTIKRVLVSFGGADPQNETLKVLKVLARFKALRVDVVVGGSHPYKEVIRRFYARHPRFYVHVQTSDMAHLINSADLAIGAGGTSLWERCFMGLPSLVIAIAGNQIAVAEAAALRGAAVYLGESCDVTPARLAGAIGRLLADPVIMQAMSGKAASMFDAEKVRSLPVKTAILGAIK